MSGRPGWQEQYWKRMDKDTARRIRTTCPRCGSPNTYYNEHFRTWRCGKCEYSFVVKGVKGDGERPWWRRIFRKRETVLGLA